MKFLVLYQMSHDEMDDWLKVPAEEREAQEKNMQAEWKAWAKEYSGAITETGGVGKPKRITTLGSSDARNDIMMYSFIQAESMAGAEAMFKNHPHFGIPGSWIEVMPVNQDISF